MAGVNWNHRNGAPRRETGNGTYREGRELTVSRMGAFSAFGTGSRRDVDGGGALEREMHAGEFESGVFMTKRTRHWYLWTWVVTAKLQAASASGYALGRGD